MSNMGLKNAGRCRRRFGRATSALDANRIGQEKNRFKWARKIFYRAQYIDID
jgi:hypothetical protein